MNNTVTEAVMEAPVQGHPLSFAQQRLWFIDNLEGGSSQYNMPVAIRLRGRLDEAALRGALELIVERHAVLRTVFAMRGADVVGQVMPPAPLVLARAALAAGEGEGGGLPPALEALMDEEAHRPFDLARDPMLRAMLVALEGGDEPDYVMLVTFHHVAFDGWSLRIFVQELLTSYAALAQGAAPALPPLPMQYADYARWQKERLGGDLLQRMAGYWQRQLEGIPQVHALPLDRKRPARQDAHGALHVQRIGGDAVQRVHALARQCRITPFIVLQSLFAVLLHLRSGQDDIVMGSPIAGRTHEEIEPLIGLFVNTLVLRTRVAGAMRFDELLQHSRDMALDAYEHQELPFEMLLDRIRPERSLSYAPVFQIMFSLGNASPGTAALPGLRVSEMESRLRKVKCDLELVVEETGAGLVLRWMYASSLFDPGTIERMGAHFALLLDEVLADPGARIEQLPLLTAAERALLLAWNDTALPFPADSTICGMVEAQAGRTPHAVALQTDDGQLSYGELERRANQLAHCLVREHGVGGGKAVGLAVERSAEMVVGLLAIMKAGGAYVPLDAAHPPERLAYMIEDSGATLVLVQPHSLERLAGLPATLLAIDDAARFAHYPDSAPEARCHAGSLAYAIYTSGSTGRPKGTLNLHRGVCNRLHTLQHQFALQPHDRVLQKTPLSFDVSVWELFWPLSTGATLVLARPDGHKDPAYLAATVRRHGVTLLHFVPSMLQMFLSTADTSGLQGVRYLMTSGEALSAELQARCIEAFPGTRLINHYGPTETAIEVSWWAFDAPRADRKVPIGRPVANTQLHILDRHDRPVPVGVVGELHIGGVQVGEGYLNQPELTAQKFVVRDLFGSAQRLYRTGDLARWLDDGNIEYIGRIDHQIKLRGMRVELGEIEQHAARVAGVAAAIVTVDGEDARQRLVAYLVARDPSADAAALAGAVREALARVLPLYMVPAVFMPIPAVPLSVNGKIDLKALPAPAAPAVQAAQAAPAAGIEQDIGAVWAAQLRIAPESIGVHHSFFELGGNSLSIIGVQAALRAAGHEVAIADLFQYPTIHQLGKFIETGATGRVTRNAEFRSARDRMLKARGLPRRT